MIPRYTLPEMGAIWTDENKFSIWERIEVLAAEAWARLGVVPADAADAIRERASFTLERIAEHEAVTDHDVVAFVRTLAESVGPGADSGVIAGRRSGRGPRPRCARRPAACGRCRGCGS